MSPLLQVSVGEGTLTFGMVFTAFFVMLGPVKIIAPFAKLTAGMEEGAARRLALEATGIACAGGIVASIFGQRILASWDISLNALRLAAGLVLLLVALRATLDQYAPPREAPTAEGRGNLAFSPLAFPIILTPYGLAILILILAVFGGLERDAAVFAIFLLVMLLDLAVMWFARAIVRRGGWILALFGAVLVVMQVALAIELILDALRALGVW